MLGERPASGAEAAEAWQRLAIALERHRLQFDIDVAKDGPLGPSPADPAVGATIAYRDDRDRLARDIARLRHPRNLGPHPQIRDPRAHPAPDRALDPGR
jgi:hypothetical protein